METRGRKQKPHQASWGEHITGLYKCPDGRWRIIATGEKFTEHDERKAVAKFRAWEAKNNPGTIAITAPVANLREIEAATARPAPVEFTATDGNETRPVTRLTAEFLLELQRQNKYETPVTINATRQTPEGAFWFQLGQLLRNQPALVAEKTGIPEIAGLAHFPIPKDPLKLSAIAEIYKTRNAATAKAKNEALAVFHRFATHTHAHTLADLTTPKLLAFRDHIEKTVAGAGTRAAYYGRCKAIIAFAKEEGLDTVQITQTLDRMAVLKTKAKKPQVDPHPISREDFHKLLNAGNGSWRPWLLLGLNLCMHLGAVCKLQWAEFDLDRGTYAAIRGKTKDKRIPQAATLWPETIEALKGIARRGQSPYVFVSNHGKDYNRNTRGNDFAELRDAAGLPKELTFDWIRDGAYTAAVRDPAVEERFARVLAGHRSHGLQDNYVLRNPEIVRPACEAVHRAYFE